jgi:uncharacterized protein
MGLHYHSLSPKIFDALAAGGGGWAAAEELRRTQYSKHFLLLRGVVMTAEQTGHEQAALAARGYEVLAEAQRQAPGPVAALIQHPSVGAWARRTIVALRGGADTPGATPGGLAAVGAAAMVMAGLTTEIDVPVNNGIATLPSLGSAGPFSASTVSVRHHIPRTQISAGSQVIEIADNIRQPAPGWHPLRLISDDPFELLLDDSDPFRLPAAPHLAPVDDIQRWSCAFRSAWGLLDRHHPETADEVKSLIKVIVPVAKPPRGQASSSSPETFGAIGLSEPEDACEFASTLAHETQHVKLSALLDLTPLTLPDDGARFYAPWREDPRPASGLLQGAYAYVGVSGFWRCQREFSSEIEAHVEFARWREAAAFVVRTLLSSGRLTAEGNRFVRGMVTTLDAWQNEPVPQAARRQAANERERHMTRWQSRHGVIPVT